MVWKIHITRAEKWYNNDDCPITQEEWLAFFKNDPELILNPRDKDPCFAHWLSHELGNEHPWFD